MDVVNLWHVCAARVTVVAVSVYLCVCVCLLSHISPLGLLFVIKTLSPTQRATKVKKINMPLNMIVCALKCEGSRISLWLSNACS